MGERVRRQVFADVVREVQARPVAPEPRTGGITDPDGTHWLPLEKDISAARALSLAAAGAAVAWDDCGCGGYCGITWFSPDQVARLVAAGPPDVRRTKRRQGALGEWVSDDGRRLVVAEDAVRWADLLA